MRNRLSGNDDWKPREQEKQGDKTKLHKNDEIRRKFEQGMKEAMEVSPKPTKDHPYKGLSSDERNQQIINDLCAAIKAVQAKSKEIKKQTGKDITTIDDIERFYPKSLTVGMMTNIEYPVVETWKENRQKPEIASILNEAITMAQTYQSDGQRTSKSVNYFGSLIRYMNGLQTSNDNSVIQKNLIKLEERYNLLKDRESSPATNDEEALNVFNKLKDTGIIEYSAAEIQNKLASGCNKKVYDGLLTIRANTSELKVSRAAEVLMVNGRDVHNQYILDRFDANIETSNVVKSAVIIADFLDRSRASKGRTGVKLYLEEQLKPFTLSTLKQKYLPETGGTQQS